MMTVQEFAQKYKAQNPQYAHIDDLELTNDLVNTYPELKSKVDIQPVPKKRITQATKTAKSEPVANDSNTNYLVGAGKSLLRTGIDIAKMADSSMPQGRALDLIPGVKSAKEKLYSSIDKTLESKTPKEKVGGYVETAAEFVFPALKVAKLQKTLKTASALDMSLQELKGLSAGKFKKIFNIDKSELETVGGVISSETKKMPAKVKELAAEFKGILTGNPTEDLKAVKTAKSSLWQETVKLIEGNNKSLNSQQIRTAIKRKLEENITFDSPFQRKEILDKTIEPFMSKIKTGTLKGLEEARGRLSSSGRDASGKLKQANDLLHTAVKDYIKDQLPKEKQVVYDALKQKYAKLFDVQEILKAKNSPALLSGTSKLKSAAKWGAGLVTGGVAGNWLLNKLR